MQKENRIHIDKFYLANLSLISAIFLSIIVMFAVQFRVEGLQDEISKTENDIVAYRDKIQLLEVEWVYLTRPERLRSLAAHYLQDNGYALASQIKGADKLESYYLANYQKVEAQEVAENEEVPGQQIISF